MPTEKDAHREKTMVALSSVGAAIGLTSIKIIVALLTGSLGILAEAAHSGLDLVAALMTFFAVRVADRPADATHHYGHGKVENLSAFLEAGLLLPGFHATAFSCASRGRMPVPCRRNKRYRPSGSRGRSWATLAHNLSKSWWRARSLNRLSSTSTRSRPQKIRPGN